jgi:hypothetical protein
MTEADVLKLNKPKANQPVEYYQNFLQHLEPVVGLFEIRLGYIRWLQGTALNEAIESRKVKHGEYGRLLVLLQMSKSTAYNCRVLAKQIPLVNARKLGYSEMLKIAGLINDQVQEFTDYEDDDSEFDLSVTDEPEYDEGTQPLPNITYHSFLPKLESVRNTLEAICQMDYGTESPEQALERYLEAQKHLTQIKRFCSKVEKMVNKRIGTNRKGRRTRNSA